MRYLQSISILAIALIIASCSGMLLLPLFRFFPVAVGRDDLAAGIR